MLGDARGFEAVSVAGDADGREMTVSVLGDADGCHPEDSPGWESACYGRSVTVLGDAEGRWAVSVLRDTRSACAAREADCIAVAPLGHTSGGGLLVSACDSLIAVCLVWPEE